MLSDCNADFYDDDLYDGDENHRHHPHPHNNHKCLYVIITRNSAVSQVFFWLFIV